MTRTILTLDEVLKLEASLITSGASFISVVAETPLRHNARHRVTGDPFPFSDPRKIWWGVFSVGAEYERRVVNKITRDLGVSVEEARIRFVADKPMGKHRVINPYTGQVSKLVLESDSKPGKYYFRLYGTGNPNHRVKARIFDSSNIEITDKVDDGFLPVKYSSVKQARAGVDNEVSVMDVALDNIRNIRVGEYEYIGLPSNL